MTRRRLTDAERKKIHELHRSGVCPRQIALRLGRAQTAILLELDRAGLRRIYPRDVMSEAEIDYLRWAHSQAATNPTVATMKAIAEHLDRDRGTIRNQARKMGLTFSKGRAAEQIELDPRNFLVAELVSRIGVTATARVAGIDRSRAQRVAKTLGFVSPRKPGDHALSEGEIRRAITAAKAALTRKRVPVPRMLVAA